jgi:hypothetical protein
MNEFYTYIYFTQEDASIPTYVGKGKGRRYRDHRQANAKGHFAYHLRKQLREGVFPITVRLKHLSEEEAFNEEKRLIALYGRKDLGTGSLYNRTDGGDGPSGHVLSKAHKQRLKEAMTGRVMTTEHKARIGAAHKGRAKSEVTKQRISTAALKRDYQPLSEEHKARIALAQKAAWQKRKAK